VQRGGRGVLARFVSVLLCERHVAEPSVGGDEGFAAIDAMVALVILSTTIILSLGAVETARRASVAAAEIRHATGLMQGLLETAPRQVGVVDGQADGFAYRVATAVSKTNPASQWVQLCDRTVSVRNVRTGRNYILADAEVCPPEPKS